jgi:hypothetical protein
LCRKHLRLAFYLAKLFIGKRRGRLTAQVSGGRTLTARRNRHIQRGIAVVTVDPMPRRWVHQSAGVHAPTAVSRASSQRSWSYPHLDRDERRDGFGAQHRIGMAEIGMYTDFQVT